MICLICKFHPVRTSHSTCFSQFEIDLGSVAGGSSYCSLFLIASHRISHSHKRMRCNLQDHEGNIYTDNSLLDVYANRKSVTFHLRL